MTIIDSGEEFSAFRESLSARRVLTGYAKSGDQHPVAPVITHRTLKFEPVFWSYLSTSERGHTYRGFCIDMQGAKKKAVTIAKKVAEQSAENCFLSDDDHLFVPNAVGYEILRRLQYKGKEIVQAQWYNKKEPSLGHEI